jgi:uncharacterized protein
MMATEACVTEPYRAGIGFRTPHFEAIVATRPTVGFLEIHAENYLSRGPSFGHLETLRADYPISVHGVGLSLGSAEGVDETHLDRFAGLVDRVEPLLVSEHLSWSVVGGVYLNDLLPLPYTEESLMLVAANIARVQDRLRRPILIENPSAYLRFVQSTLTEAEYLAELAARTGCGLLLDVNNIFVTCRNIGGDPMAWLERLPVDRVAEIHLAGHARNDADGVEILIDDHGAPVAPPVWELYEAAVPRFPAARTLIEWDSNLPDLPVLVAEAEKADRRRIGLREVRYADAA